MQLAVAAVLDIVHVDATLFAQQAVGLGARYVEVVLTAEPVALHAGARATLGSAAALLAYVARLCGGGAVEVLVEDGGGVRVY